MTEAEARAAIIANGYVVTLERERLVLVWEWSSSGGGRQWVGVNFLDLAQSFRLDRRAANKPPEKEGV
jgi:hypothetical protein